MIIIADLHFGKENDSYIVEGTPVQRLDLIEKLMYIGELCRSTQQVLVIAGDVFNKKNPTSEIIEVWFKFLSLFPDVEIYVIPGNHDSGTDSVNMGMVREANMGHVHVFTTPETVLVKDLSGSANVLFYPHIPLALRDGTRSIAQSWKKTTDFCVTHGQVQASDYSNDIFFEAGDALSLDLAKLPGVVFAGHIHNQGVWSNEKSTVVYPGSLAINNFGEVDEAKGFIEVSLSDPSKYALKALPEELNKVRWQHLELDLTDKDETMFDMAAVREVSKDAIIKITVIAKAYGVVDEAYLRSLFNKYGHVTRYETKVVGETTVTDSPTTTISHSRLLSEWLAETDYSVKECSRAKKLGERIITEVLG